MKLTEVQRKLLDRMIDEKLVIKMFDDFSNNECSVELSDGDNSYYVNPRTVDSLHKKGYLVYKTKYTTVQPDTESGEFTVKSI